MKKVILISPLLVLLVVVLTFSSCKNDDICFGNYDYQTVYFANQNPVRTITLGDDVYSTQLDNEHKFQIYATLGGVESNSKNRIIKFVVDNDLVKNLYFSDDSSVQAMPADYYSLNGNTITIPAGKIMGAVDVQLNDAFFNDPKSVGVTYVVPLRMVSASDSILSGKVKDGVQNPVLTNSDDWSTVPKNYVLYAVKFKNKWHGAWLSQGIDNIDDNGTSYKVVRDTDYIEHDEVRYLSTTGYMTCLYPISTLVTVMGNDNKETTKRLSCNLILTFDDNDKCTITTDTGNCTASGSGVWMHQGAKKAWGDKDRDLLVLNYNVKYNYEYSPSISHFKIFECTDSLIMRNRESKFETFDYTYKK
ncbi:MAG: DUF5627 domain-containing protein [Prevotella sp.]|jgi:hypothetical protein|nr:DUF5627 domain-containing protein [Prevotella sp.]